jgi:hypothetical protein
MQDLYQRPELIDLTDTGLTMAGQLGDWKWDKPTDSVSE